MTDSVKEQLSACLDGELPQRELALLAKRVGQDRELGASMARYSLISEALRTGKPAAVSADFAARLMTRIQDEPPLHAEVVPSQAPAAKSLRFLRPVAGLAVAASVAALALFSVQRSGLIPPQTTIAGNESISSPAAMGAEEAATDRYVVPSTSSTSAFIPATRLTNYVVAHSEYSSPLGRQRVVSGMLAEGEPELVVLMPEENVPAATEDAQR